LGEKTIDIVATDHAPGLREEKDAGWEDIWKAPSGVPGVETLLPIMLSEGVSKGRISIERMVDSLCTRPAQIFDVYPRKGAIQEGSDADLVVVDLKMVVKISAERLHYKVGWTPYEGMKVRGMPVVTISRGEVIAEDGEILGNPGHGQFLAR
jgi:dihydropyrimidinase